MMKLTKCPRYRQTNKITFNPTPGLLNITRIHDTTIDELQAQNKRQKNKRNMDQILHPRIVRLIQPPGITTTLRGAPTFRYLRVN